MWKDIYKNGRFIKKIFREGRGPQEIINAVRVVINKFTGNMFVLQENGYKLKEFDSSGKHIKSYSLPEQILYYFEFIGKNRVIYISHVRPTEKVYNNFKLVNLKTLKIEKEFDSTDRDFVINGGIRFERKDGIIWTCRGDEMRLVGYDLNRKRDKIHKNRGKI